MSWQDDFVEVTAFGDEFKTYMPIARQAPMDGVNYGKEIEQENKFIEFFKEEEFNL
jgi:hypothetical protein